MESQNIEDPKDNPTVNILHSATRDAYQLYRKLELDPDNLVNNGSLIEDLSEKMSIYYNDISIPESFIEQHKESITFVPLNLSSLQTATGNEPS